MMSKILYKYPDKQRSQKTKGNLVTDTGLKNELYTDFVQHLTKKGKKAKAEKLFRKTSHIVEQKTKTCSYLPFSKSGKKCGTFFF